MVTPRAVQLERPEEMQLLESHVSLRDIRARGSETHLAGDLYLRRMEEELSMRNLLLDEAQQRLHRAIKKAGKHQRHRAKNKAVTESA